MKTRRAAIYLRVSTSDQNTDNQEHELRQVAERAGWTVARVYKDQGISGAKGRDQRPAFDELWKGACGRKFDIVMAWSVDRLGRSLQDLVGFLAELHALKIDLCLKQQGIDTTTPAGKALFGMMGVFAEFERSIIQERVRAGLARAPREGKRLGRERLDGAADLKRALKRFYGPFHLPFNYREPQRPDLGGGWQRAWHDFSFLNCQAKRLARRTLRRTWSRTRRNPSAATATNRSASVPLRYPIRAVALISDAENAI
jgi:DNA invertase Pin-like site-specific DNA recombinase